MDIGGHWKEYPIVAIVMNFAANVYDGFMKGL